MVEEKTTSSSYSLPLLLRTVFRNLKQWFSYVLHLFHFPSFLSCFLPSFLPSILPSFVHSSSSYMCGTHARNYDKNSLYIYLATLFLFFGKPYLMDGTAQNSDTSVLEAQKWTSSLAFIFSPSPSLPMIVRFSRVLCIFP